MDRVYESEYFVLTEESRILIYWTRDVQVLQLETAEIFSLIEEALLTLWRDFNNSIQ